MPFATGSSGPSQQLHSPALPRDTLCLSSLQPGVQQSSKPRPGDPALGWARCAGTAPRTHSSVTRAPSQTTSSKGGHLARSGHGGLADPLNTAQDPGTSRLGGHSSVLPDFFLLLFFPFMVLSLKGGSPHLSPALCSLPSVVSPALQEGMAISVSSQGIFPPTLSGPGGNCQL